MRGAATAKVRLPQNEATALLTLKEMTPHG
jgi:hypothetical protein